MPAETDLRKKIYRILRRLTPFVWVFFLCILGIISGFIRANETNGWSLLIIGITCPIAFGTMIVDYILKAVITKGYLKIWLIEILIRILVVVIFTYPK